MMKTLMIYIERCLRCLQGAPGAPAAPAAPAAPPKDENKPETNDAEDDSKFDHFMGNDAGALAGTFGEYDQDDREADEVSIPHLNSEPSLCNLENHERLSVALKPHEPAILGHVERCYRLVRYRLCVLLLLGRQPAAFYVVFCRLMCMQS